VITHNQAAFWHRAPNLEELSDMGLVRCDVCREPEEEDWTEELADGSTVCRYCASAVVVCTSCKSSFSRVGLDAAGRCEACAPGEEH
jgi:hypothetical protein